MGIIGGTVGVDVSHRRRTTDRASVCWLQNRGRTDANHWRLSAKVVESSALPDFF